MCRSEQNIFEGGAKGMNLKHLIKNAAITFILTITVLTAGVVELTAAESIYEQNGFEQLVFGWPDDEE